MMSKISISDVNGASLSFGGVEVSFSFPESHKKEMLACKKVFMLLGREMSSCAYCEYFDGGGARNVERAQNSGGELHGDCLNKCSPRFQTYAIQTCGQFLASVDADV